MGTEEEKIARSHCNYCLKETKHRLLHSVVQNFDDEENFVYGATEYQMLECLGCESVTFREVSTSSEDRDEEGNLSESFTYYPPRTERPEPSWINDLWRQNETLRDLLKEIYVAFHADARTLAAAGIRTLIDATMTAKVKDQGSFLQTLRQFEKAGFIAQRQVDVLKDTIDAGSASAHRAFTPRRSDLRILLDIAENLIENVFIHPVQMKETSRRVPKRRRKRKQAVVQVMKSTP